MATAPTLTLRALEEGSAVSLEIVVPDDSVEVRVLRRSDKAPSTSQDVGDGAVLYSAHPSGLDARGTHREHLDYGTLDSPLLDGKTYYYGAFSRDAAGTWAGATAAAAPSSKITLSAIDPAEVLIKRLAEKVQRLLQRTDEVGQYVFDFGDEVRGKSVPMPVYEAFPYEEDSEWPCFSVHLDGDAQTEAFIGGGGRDRSWSDRLVQERHGTNAAEVTIIGWSTKQETRRLLRKLLRAALHEDRLFYERAGLNNLSLDGPKDAEDFTSANVPIYNCVAQVSCNVSRRPMVKHTEKVVSVENRALALVASGLVSSATSTTLTDGTQAWEVDVFHRGNNRHLVRVTTGAAAGQQRVVASNTATVLTLADAWTTVPAVGAAYQIYLLDALPPVEYQTREQS